MRRVPVLLSPEQNDLFDERMRHWQDVLGLKDWRVERRSGKTPAMADVLVDVAARFANYRTGDFGRVGATPAAIDSTACHESLHVLLAEFKHVVHMEADATIIESAEHRIVNTIEKLLTAKGAA